MPRSIWNGTITFGLIAVPIKVHSAIEDGTVHFHQVHAKDGARIKQTRICSKEGKEVPYEEVVKGYEIRNGEYSVLSKDEIAAAAGERSHVIELEEFVSGSEIDPVQYDRTYYLGTGKDGAGAYRLLHDALQNANRTGIGRWAFHDREYLVAVRPLEDVLALHTMRFADELVNAEDLDLPQPRRAPTSREVEMAGKLVDALHGSFDPSAFRDTYRERVLELSERKARGEEPPPPEPTEVQEPPELLAALKASLGSASTGKRRPRSTSKSKSAAKARS